MRRTCAASTKHKWSQMRTNSMPKKQKNISERIRRREEAEHTFMVAGSRVGIKVSIVEVILGYAFWLGVGDQLI